MFGSGAMRRALSGATRGASRYFGCGQGSAAPGAAAATGGLLRSTSPRGEGAHARAVGAHVWGRQHQQSRSFLGGLFGGEGKPVAVDQGDGTGEVLEDLPEADLLPPDIDLHKLDPRDAETLLMSTGQERDELIAKARGYDFWEEDWLNTPDGTESEPTVVPSYYGERIVGCALPPPDDNQVFWGKVVEGEPPVRIGPQWFVLHRITPEEEAAHVGPMYSKGPYGRKGFESDAFYEAAQKRMDAEYPDNAQIVDEDGPVKSLPKKKAPAGVAKKKKASP